MEVKGFYSKGSSVRASSGRLGDFVHIEIDIPVGREKDAVDLISLITDKGEEVNLKLTVRRATASNLGEHLLTRIRDYAAN